MWNVLDFPFKNQTENSIHNSEISQYSPAIQVKNVTDVLNSSTIQVQNVIDVLNSPACDFQGNKTSLTELSADCRSLMLTLDLQNLLNIAETNHTLRMLAAEVFCQKYSNCIIKIDNNDRSSPNKSNTIEEINQFPVLMDERTILVFGLNVSLKLLRNFGPAIKKLSIHSHRFWAFEEQTIMGFVNEYCGESLIKLDLEIDRHDMIKKLTGPFENVTELSCNVVDSEIQGITTQNQQTLNKIFPNIENLTLSLKSNTSTDFVGRLPHLRSLTLKGDAITAQSFFNTKYTDNLLNRNAQIEALKLIFYPPDYVRKVKVYLPDVESLSLWFFNLTNDPVSFEHVKKFELLSKIDGSPLKIQFKQLQELRMWYEPRYAHEWITFLGMSPHLKRVHVKDFGDIESTLNLQSLLTQLPEIEEMSILSYKTIHFETIVKFIETHGRLKRFKYGSRNFDVSISLYHIEYMKKEFGQNWTITEFNGNYSGLLFQRKNSKV